ncbi:alcohol dehydrogenase catalytic domain-containing protein [Salinispira pacifica]
MKAVRLFGKEDLRVVEVEKPKPAAGEILVRGGAALICGTDVRMYKNGASVVPVTLGHELAGTIEALGPGVTHYREGMRVAVAPNMGCGVCDECVSGHTELCAELRALGINLDGGFADYFIVPAAAVSQGNVVELGEQISFQEAAIAEPLSCVYNSFERCHTQPGDSVLVIGAGPIGLMHAKLHKLAGAGRVMIHDINESRLAICKRDDESFITVGPDQPKERVYELTGGRGADVVITAASAPATQQFAFQVAALNARVIFFGGLPKGKEQVSLDTNVIHYKMITVTGTSRQSLRQYRQCLKLIDQGVLDVRGIITRTMPLEQAQEAIETVVRGEGLKTGFVMA